MSYNRFTTFVAPLAGSVDRNVVFRFQLAARAPSLPSRGAWIEMSEMQLLRSIRGVAPLAGSVDRNDTETLESIYEKLSLPSRGAWIEILH